MNLARKLVRLLPWALAAGQSWLIDRLIKEHGRALLEQDRQHDRLTVIERQLDRMSARKHGATVGTSALGEGHQAMAQADPISASSFGYTGRAAGTTHYLPYHRMQDEALRATPPYPTKRFSGAGIVIVAGGPRYYTNAWVCLTMLRRVVDCRLPIQIWYLGPDEMSPRMIELLSRFDVECINALDVRRQHPTRTLSGWECKPYAILHSRFKEVILLDADNVPLVDPAVLLSHPEYRATGAIFWPDIRSLSPEEPIWEICRVAYRDEPEFETGQIVIDKERCWAALHLAMHLNSLSDFYYQHIYGDKETFHMAWRMLDQPYSMPSHLPRRVTGLTSSGDANFADVLQQHDFDDQLIFQHRTGAKWTAWGKNFRVPGFQYEAICLEALQELRQLWSGHADLSSVLTGVTAPEAGIIRSRYFLYRRTGSDQRVLALLPGGRIGDGRGMCEQRWRLEDEQGRLHLVLEGYTMVTCKLTRDGDGAWRGNWLHYEKMPVELIPLSEMSPE